MSVAWRRRLDRNVVRRGIGYAVLVVGVLVAIWGLIDPGSFGGTLLDIVFDAGTVSSGTPNHPDSTGWNAVASQSTAPPR